MIKRFLPPVRSQTLVRPPHNKAAVVGNVAERQVSRNVCSLLMFVRGIGGWRPAVSRQLHLTGRPFVHNEATFISPHLLPSVALRSRAERGSHQQTRKVLQFLFLVNWSAAGFLFSLHKSASPVLTFQPLIMSKGQTVV